MKIDFQSQNLPSPVSPDVALCLFRVLQEALHNAAKHSQVSHFDVQLRGMPGEIQLTIKDAGVGFDVESANKGRGLGLISMRERVKLVNGTISIDSKLREGTAIRVRIPVRVPPTTASRTDILRGSPAFIRGALEISATMTTNATTRQSCTWYGA